MNIGKPFAADYCSPTIIDAPFAAGYCMSANVDALSPFSSGVTQRFEGYAVSFSGPLQTSVGIPSVAFGNFIKARNAKVVAMSILHLFGHHEAFRGFLFLDLDSCLVVLEECFIGIPLLLGLQHSPM